MVKQNVGGQDRLLRAVLAVVLTVLAASRLRQGKYGAGLLALVTAAGFGFNATTCVCGVNERLGIDTTSE